MAQNGGGRDSREVRPDRGVESGVYADERISTLLPFSPGQIEVRRPSIEGILRSENNKSLGEIVGDLDYMEVTKLAGWAIESLGELESMGLESSRDDFKEVIKSFRDYIHGFDINRNSDDRAKYRQLAVAFQDDTIAERLYNGCYREELRRTLTLVQRYTSKDSTVEQKEAVWKFVKNLATTQDPAHTIAPFSSVADEILACNSREDALAAIEAKIKTINDRFSDKNAVIEEKGKGEKREWERDTRIPDSVGGSFKEISRRARTAIAEAEANHRAYPVYDATLNTEFSGMLGLTPRAKDTIHLERNTIETVDANGRRVLRDVKTPTIEIYMNARAVKIPLGVASKRSSFKLENVKIFSADLRSLTQIEQFLDQLRIQPDGGAEEIIVEGKVVKVMVPIIDRSGKPTFLVVTADQHRRMVETCEKSAETFNKLGLTRDTYKVRELNQHLEETSARPQSWMEFSSASRAIDELYGTARPENMTQQQRAEWEDARAEMANYFETQNLMYGRYSRYEELAKQRVPTPEGEQSPRQVAEYKQKLLEEIERIALEFNIRAAVLKHTASEMADLAQNPRQAEKLRKRLLNLDYEIEIETLSRMMLLYGDSGNENATLAQIKNELEAFFYAAKRGKDEQGPGQLGRLLEGFNETSMEAERLETINTTRRLENEDVSPDLLESLRNGLSTAYIESTWVAQRIGATVDIRVRAQIHDFTERTNKFIRQRPEQEAERMENFLREEYGYIHTRFLSDIRTDLRGITERINNPQLSEEENLEVAVQGIIDSVESIGNRAGRYLRA